MITLFYKTKSYMFNSNSYMAIVVAFMMIFSFTSSGQELCGNHTSDGVYVVPAGVSSFTVEAWGAGGGGGSAGIGQNAGGGGGGGAYASLTIPVSNGESYVVTVGVGGGSNSDGGNSFVSGPGEYCS